MRVTYKTFIQYIDSSFISSVDQSNFPYGERVKTREKLNGILHYRGSD